MEAMFGCNWFVYGALLPFLRAEEYVRLAGTTARSGKTDIPWAALVLRDFPHVAIPNLPGIALYRACVGGCVCIRCGEWVWRDSAAEVAYINVCGCAMLPRRYPYLHRECCGSETPAPTTAPSTHACPLCHRIRPIVPIRRYS